LLEVIVKLQKPICWLVLTVFALLIESCLQANGMSATPSRMGTPDLNDSATPTQLPTINPTSIATFSSAPTGISTLPMEDAQLAMLNLLTNNGNCRLPCLWGITPGKSTFDESRSILEPLASISDFTAFESNLGAINPIYVEGDVRIHTNVRYRADPNDNFVNSISFYAQALREISQGNYEELFGYPLYDRLLKAYSLPQILTSYGTPADILIRTNLEPPPQNWGPFELLISYPEQGILVHYTTLLNAVGPNIIGCPTKSKLELYLVPSRSFNSTNDLLESRAAPLKIEEIFPGFRPVEEVTSLSLDDFVRIFSQPTGECIETPASYWPSP
jgi:hypothetical protein